MPAGGINYCFNPRRLKRLRELNGDTQMTLAKRANLNYRTVSRLELGKSRPRASTLNLLAEALEVRIKDFYDDDGDAVVMQLRVANGGRKGG